MRARLLTLSALAAAGTLCSGLVSADDSANMQIIANVAPACQIVSVVDVNFGTLDPLINNDATGTINWVCTNGTSTDIEINGGGSGNILARTMAGPAAPLPYQLYTDAGRNNIWGDSGTGNVVGVTGVGYGTVGNVTVYGRVAQADAENATNGNYLDTVIVTILF